VSKPARKNVTISLPEPLLRKFRVYAASQNQSLSGLAAEAIRKMLEHDSEYERAKRRFFASMQNAPDLGTHGQATWTREELHER